MKFESQALSLGLSPIEMHGASTKSKSISIKAASLGGEGAELDCNMWLPMAAEEYMLSPTLSDYILVPVPSIVTELPNTNGDSASKEELLRFNTEQGCMAYKTFKGKPAFQEHANKDVTKAKGVILDTYLSPIPKFKGNHLKLMKLVAFDRTKDPELCKAILQGKINTYSMGMWYKSFKCSLCGHVATSEKDLCTHTNTKKKTYIHTSGQLVYRKCQYITGFELSAVNDPAFVSATSDTVMNPLDL